MDKHQDVRLGCRQSRNSVLGSNPIGIVPVYKEEGAEGRLEATIA